MAGTPSLSSGSKSNFAAGLVWVRVSNLRWFLLGGLVAWTGLTAKDVLVPYPPLSLLPVTPQPARPQVRRHKVQALLLDAGECDPSCDVYVKPGSAGLTRRYRSV